MALTLKRQRFYVYALLDPRNAELFYIGKGTGNRCDQHLSEWRAGMITNPHKYARIDEIARAGAEPTTILLHTDLSESEAYRIERQTIAAIGIDNLTNQSPGTVSAAEAARKHAALLFGRIKPVDQWLAERPRPPADIELYQFVTNGLRRLAHA